MSRHDRFVASRRSLLRSGGALAVTGLVAGCEGLAGGSTGSAASSDPTHASPDLATFVADLTVPETKQPSGERDGHPHYEVMMREATRSFHPDLGDTTIWGYDGRFPGPTFEVVRGTPVSVHWANDDLPADHFLPVDTSLRAQRGQPEVRSVVHVHGSNVDSVADGYPEAWYTPDGGTTGPYYAGETYTYANRQPPTTLWYHDHVLGESRLNVYAGLAGLYVVRGDVGGTDRLPSGDYEIPLVLQDRAFEDDGSPYYPGPETDGVSPSIVEMFFGDVATVNGTAWPRLSVEPRRYRFRILNASNARFYDLSLRGYDPGAGELTGEGGPRLVQVATDGGYLNAPVTLDGVVLGPAMRGQFVVDFSDHAGESLLLHNAAEAPYVGGDPSAEDESPLPEVMRIDVQDVDVTDEGELPDAFGPLPRLGGATSETHGSPVPRIDPVDAVRERTLTLTETEDEHGRVVLLLDGLRYDDAVTERPTVGTTEVWHLANESDDVHPIHLHLVQFQVLGRQGFDVDLFGESGAISPTTERRPPRDQEVGWHDTVLAPAGDVTSVVVHFGAVDGLFRDVTGRYVWHCHMLEHANHEMIRPFEVDPAGFHAE